MAETLTVHKFSTDSYAGSDCLAVWLEEIAPNRAAYDFLVQDEDADRFQASAKLVAITPYLQFAEFNFATPTIVSRSSRHVLDGRDSYMFHINRRGVTHMIMSKTNDHFSMLEMQGVLTNVALPRVSKTLNQRNNNRYTSYVLEIERECLLRKFPKADTFCFQKSSFRTAAFRQLVDIFDGLTADGLVLDCVGATSELIQDLLIIYLTNEKDVCRRGWPETRIQTWYLAEIISSIDRNYTRPEFSGDEVARCLNISQRYIQCLLRDTGKTFVDQVTDRRLSLAARILMYAPSQSHSIELIAFTCGFSSSSYFNRLFRKHYGMTPSDFLNHRKSLSNFNAACAN